MSSKRRRNRSRRSGGEEYRFTVRGIRREPVDIRKLSRALINLVMAEAERQAQAEHTRDAEPEVTSNDEAQSGGDGDA
jgi:hypothetical protein